MKESRKEEELDTRGKYCGRRLLNQSGKRCDFLVCSMFLRLDQKIQEKRKGKPEDVRELKPKRPSPTKVSTPNFR